MEKGVAPFRAYLVSSLAVQGAAVLLGVAFPTLYPWDVALPGLVGVGLFARGWKLAPPRVATAERRYSIPVGALFPRLKVALSGAPFDLLSTDEAGHCLKLRVGRSSSSFGETVCWVRAESNGPGETVVRVQVDRGPVNLWYAGRPQAELERIDGLLDSSLGPRVAGS